MTEQVYSSSLPLIDARSDYFRRSGFDADGGYGSRWVRLQVGPATIGFPNTSCRVRAVRLHDLHHIATEYDTDWVGEAEIAAWEVASGCRHHYAAWLLDWGGFALGLVIAPRRVFKAFVRGRRSRNLYNGEFEDALLERTVGELRNELALPAQPVRVSPADWLAFAFWSAVSVGVTVGPFVLAAAVAGFLLFRL